MVNNTYNEYVTFLLGLKGESFKLESCHTYIVKNKTTFNVISLNRNLTDGVFTIKRQLTISNRKDKELLSNLITQNILIPKDYHIYFKYVGDLYMIDPIFVLKQMTERKKGITVLKEYPLFVHFNLDIDYIKYLGQHSNSIDAKAYDFLYQQYDISMDYLIISKKGRCTVSSRKINKILRDKNYDAYFLKFLMTGLFIPDGHSIEPNYVSYFSMDESKRIYDNFRKTTPFKKVTVPKQNTGYKRHDFTGTQKVILQKLAVMHDNKQCAIGIEKEPNVYELDTNVFDMNKGTLKSLLDRKLLRVVKDTKSNKVKFVFTEKGYVFAKSLSDYVPLDKKINKKYLK